MVDLQPTPTTEDQNLTPGERLKAARLAAGYQTVAEAARAHKIHPQNLADHEAGRRKIHAEQARLYAQAFSTTPGQILFGETDPREIRDIRLVMVMSIISQGFEPSSILEETEWGYVPVEGHLFPDVPLTAFRVVNSRTNNGSVVIVGPRNSIGIKRGDTVVVLERERNLIRYSLKTASSTDSPLEKGVPADPASIVGVVVLTMQPRASFSDALIEDSKLLLT